MNVIFPITSSKEADDKTTTTPAVEVTDTPEAVITSTPDPADMATTTDDANPKATATADAKQYTQAEYEAAVKRVVEEAKADVLRQFAPTHDAYVEREFWDKQAKATPEATPEPKPTPTVYDLPEGPLATPEEVHAFIHETTEDQRRAMPQEQREAIMRAIVADARERVAREVAVTERVRAGQKAQPHDHHARLQELAETALLWNYGRDRR